MATTAIKNAKTGVSAAVAGIIDHTAQLGRRSIAYIPHRIGRVSGEGQCSVLKFRPHEMDEPSPGKSIHPPAIRNATTGVDATNAPMTFPPPPQSENLLEDPGSYSHLSPYSADEPSNGIGEGQSNYGAECKRRDDEQRLR